MAEDSRLFPVRSDEDPEFFLHRWPAFYLRHLVALPPDASAPSKRARVLQLLAEASTYYQSHPLNDHFEGKVAEIEAGLRKHWGESGTHAVMIRRQFDALLRRAEFHQSTTSPLLAAHFFREARRLAEQQRQYFQSEDLAKLQLAEQSAIESIIAGGELKTIAIPLEIPMDVMDHTRASPEETVTALVDLAIQSIPNRSELETRVKQGNAEAPLQALFGRTLLGPGKVVGETSTPEQNLVLDVEAEATRIASIVGAAVSITARRAANAVALSPEHLVAPLESLALDADTISMVQHGCERLLAGDFVSATHILVPHVEDALRQHLKHLGVDTTEFRKDAGDGSSRTDDATLGSLMRKSLPDGRTVLDYLSSDVWHHLNSTLNSQTGLNLRNEFAHGLARSRHCTPEIAGLALSLFYIIAEYSRRNASDRNATGRSATGRAATGESAGSA
jgi:hypothetical protein